MKFIAIVLGVLLMVGCGTTVKKVSKKEDNFEYQRIDSGCADQVFERVNIISLTPGGLISSAQNAEFCIQDIQFSTRHPDNQLAMRLQALAVNQYVQAGAIKDAKRALSRFKTRFPMQDLLYDDFTSFVDTAYALLEHDNISPHKLSRLNINNDLKTELNRQRKWMLQ